MEFYCAICLSKYFFHTFRDSRRESTSRERVRWTGDAARPMSSGRTARHGHIGKRPGFGNAGTAHIPRTSCSGSEEFQQQQNEIKKKRKKKKKRKRNTPCVPNFLHTLPIPFPSLPFSFLLFSSLLFPSLLPRYPPQCQSLIQRATRGTG